MFQGFYDSALVLAVCRVEVILDAVVGAARQLFCDISPPIAILLMQVKDSFFLILVDGRFFNKRIQMIVPSKKLKGVLFHVKKFTFLGTICLSFPIF